MASKTASYAWQELRKQKKPRGNPRAGYEKRVLNESVKLQEKSTKSKEDIAADATKELESLAEHMPDISDSDARVLALRMYYIELAEGVSPSDAQQRVGKMFLVCSRTVKRCGLSRGKRI